MCVPSEILCSERNCAMFFPEHSVSPDEEPFIPKPRGAVRGRRRDFQGNTCRERVDRAGCGFFRLWHPKRRRRRVLLLLPKDAFSCSHTQKSLGFAQATLNAVRQCRNASREASSGERLSRRYQAPARSRCFSSHTLSAARSRRKFFALQGLRRVRRRDSFEVFMAKHLLS